MLASLILSNNITLILKETSAGSFKYVVVTVTGSCAPVLRAGFNDIGLARAYFTGMAEERLEEWNNGDGDIYNAIERV